MRGHVARVEEFALEGFGLPQVGLGLVEYLGFLRRDPEDPPDTDLSGFNFRLRKMDSFTQPGEDARLGRDAFERITRAEMIRAFIVSDEYRKRFGR